MIHEIAVTDEVTIVFSHEDCGYADVLATLGQAEWVDVVTYNISSHDDALLKQLRGLGAGIRVRIVTNIPKRFPHYYGYEVKKKFRTMLGTYRTLLDPAGFTPAVASFFNVSNHSKIIMTDKLAYIGSSNFSSESAGHYECGVLIDNPAIIEQIREQIVTPLVENSAPRDLSAIGEAKLFVSNIRKEMKELILTLKDGFYGPLDDMGIGPDHFRWQDAEVSDELLARISNFVTEIEEGLESYDEHAHLSILTNHIDGAELTRIRDMVEDEDSPLVRLAEWDQDASVQKHWQEYAHEAYDEKVDVYSDKANDDADEEYGELLVEVKAAFKELVETVLALNAKMKGAMTALQQLEASKWGVDNS